MCTHMRGRAHSPEWWMESTEEEENLCLDEGGDIYMQGIQGLSTKKDSFGKKCSSNKV